MIHFAWIAAALPLLLLLLKRGVNARRANPNNLPLPPRPPTKWLIGNLLDMPSVVDWINLKRWRSDFGDLTYLKAFGTSVLVINTVQAADDLLDRGQAYAHRPRLVMAGELMNMNRAPSLMPYGPRFKLARKMMQRTLNLDAVQRYTSSLEQSATLLLSMLLRKPDDFESAIRFIIDRIILSISYGITAKDAKSEYIIRATRTNALIDAAVIPGAYVVDLIPALKYLPRWFPFISFHRDAEVGRKLIFEYVHEPFVHVKNKTKQGSERPSFVADLLKDVSSECTEDVEELIMWSAGALHGAGTATSGGITLTFVRLMVLHEEVQQKAQKELDGVLRIGDSGEFRLPKLTDRPRLPYVEAIIKEIYRWHPVVPLCVPHFLVENDYYKGRFIPKDTIVFANIWAMGRYDEQSINPTEFNPERFYQVEEKGGGFPTDPYSYTFGFGRRICPGRYLGDNMVFIMVASILSAFTIMRQDGSPRELLENLKFMPHLTSSPERFACDIRPRSPSWRAVIEEAVKRADFDDNND